MLDRKLKLLYTLHTKGGRPVSKTLRRGMREEGLRVGGPGTSKSSVIDCVVVSVVHGAAARAPPVLQRNLQR